MPNTGSPALSMIPTSRQMMGAFNLPGIRVRSWSETASMYERVAADRNFLYRCYCCPEAGTVAVGCRVRGEWAVVQELGHVPGRQATQALSAAVGLA